MVIAKFDRLGFSGKLFAELRVRAKLSKEIASE